MAKRKKVCGICGEEVACLDSHMLLEHTEGIERVEEKQPIIRRSAENVFDRQKKLLEKQNEMLMLQIQQQSLLKALQTGHLPGQEQQQGGIKEALDLIKSIREQFPAGEPQEDPQDMLMMEAMDIIKAKVLQSQIPTPPPPATPPTPWEDLEEETIPPPPTIDYGEPKEEEKEEENENTEPSSPMGDSVLPKAKQHKPRVSVNKKAIGKQETLTKE